MISCKAIATYTLTRGISCIMMIYWEQQLTQHHVQYTPYSTDNSPLQSHTLRHTLPKALWVMWY